MNFKCLRQKDLLEEKTINQRNKSKKKKSSKKQFLVEDKKFLTLLKVEYFL